jgi:N-acyl-D-aspartate/D-glutamate deacylase
MPATPDLVIRGGTVADGLGGAPYEADIAIGQGRILAVGKLAPPPRGTAEINARGKLITPGFVDIHTHYDGQATWSSRLDSSSWHGVTTALIGNCGVGFAPCLPERRDILVALMEGVEDLPEVVLTEGLPWTWQSFPEFLDVLGQRRFDTDIATQVPHAALRIHVMGQRAAEHEPANQADRAEMARLAAEAVRAGALGFSTSRALAHKTLDGRHTPTLRAEEEELAEIGRALGREGAGWLQVISDFDDPGAEFAMLRRVAEAAGRPMTFSLLQREKVPWLWRFLLDRIGEANAAGTPITGQVMARPIGLMLGFELSQNPFFPRPSWKRIAPLPFEQRLAALRDPAFRRQLLSEPTTDPAMIYRLSTWDRIFPLGDPPNYEPAPEQSLAAMAERQGVPVEELAYDLMLARGGRGILNRPIINYADFNLEAAKTMIEHPNTLMGLGDGGAHVGLICDASSTTSMITHWTRDRTRGAKLPLGFVIKRLTRDNAVAIGLQDRGAIAPGLRADINVIDYDRLGVATPEIAYDLPAGGKRMLQRASGYEATILAGEVVYREGEATGALPGRLVRGAQQAS